MTTDTLPKAISRQAVVGGKTVTISGIAKGAGMIRPNMATMLGYVATDAAVAPALMNHLAKQLAENEQTIVKELAEVQGKPVDIGGYYKPDFSKLEQVMRPSKTFNAALASVKA